MSVRDDVLEIAARHRLEPFNDYPSHLAEHFNRIAGTEVDATIRLISDSVRSGVLSIDAGTALTMKHSDEIDGMTVSR